MTVKKSIGTNGDIAHEDNDNIGGSNDDNNNEDG